ncbi:MAG: hypothetical protein AAGM16_15165 [Pseudomonadota bacterium]
MTDQANMSQGEREMRRSFRIREQAFIEVRILTDSEYAAVLESRALQQPSAFGNHARLVSLENRFQEAFTLLGNASLPVRECLSALNEKLSLLFEEQPERQAVMTRLTSGDAATCEIGATGLRFDHDVHIEEGSKVFLQVLLTADRHYLETAAVVRRTPPPLNESVDGRYGVAAEFVGFSEAESELLIKHLFQRESESLRMRRLSMDD